MGNGTIRDNVSGLIWMKNANCMGKQNWHYAKYAAEVIYDGRMVNGQIADCGLSDGSQAGDWMVPWTDTWEAFMTDAYGDLPPALHNTVGNGQWTQGDAFVDVQADGYWTAKPSPNNPEEWAMVANMIQGEVFTDWKVSGRHYVWLVRHDN